MDVEQRYNELLIREARVITILERWLEAGRLKEVSFIHRIFGGNFYYYITFDRTKGSLGINKAGYVAIEADSLEDAIAKAEEMYGHHVRDVTIEYEFEPKHYHKGLLSSPEKETV